MTLVLVLAVVLVFLSAVVTAEWLAGRANDRKRHAALVKSVEQATRTRLDMGGGRLRKNPTY